MRTQSAIEPKSAGVRARMWLVVLSVITVLICGAVAAALILATKCKAGRPAGGPGDKQSARPPEGAA